MRAEALDTDFWRLLDDGLYSPVPKTFPDLLATLLHRPEEAAFFNLC